MYGPQAATLAEAFPTEVRFSGASVAYAAASILGGGFAPMIATWLHTATGSLLSVAGYLAVASLVGLIGATLLRTRTDQGVSTTEASQAMSKDSTPA